jgi:pimeloyl-ACP methyl ester carboxylesterase
VGISEFEECLRWSVRDAFPGVQSPIQCICSSWTFETHQTHLYPGFFNIKYMSGVGHFVMLENPETFNRLLAESIEELEKYR